MDPNGSRMDPSGLETDHGESISDWGQSGIRESEILRIREFIKFDYFISGLFITITPN